MTAVDFVKMNGWGNDFVVLQGPLAISSADVRALCDRRFGIGADGVLVVEDGQPIRMRYWNADGGPAEMCGNGFRCVARLALDRGLVSGTAFEIETPVGVRRVEVEGDEIAVELGPASIVGEEDIDGDRYHIVDVGNPHAVIEVDDLETAAVALAGPRVESDPRFANGTNVEFVTFDEGGVNMRVWERGVGETLACGSGMVAAALVATDRAGLGPSVKVEVPGGAGVVEFRGGAAWLRGPVEYSFAGVWERLGDQG